LTCQEAAEYYADLAKKPGWWQYTRHQVRAMEADESGQWRGITDMVRARLKGFRPAPEEAKWSGD